jgi:hypothetical protein
MDIKCIHLSSGNKPENFSKRREQCGAIGLHRSARPTRRARINRSALPGFETPLRLIDHIDAALATYDTVIPVAAAQRFQ